VRRGLCSLFHLCSALLCSTLSYSLPSLHYSHTAVRLALPPNTTSTLLASPSSLFLPTSHAARKHRSVQLPSPWLKDRYCTILLIPSPSTRRPPTTLVHAGLSLLILLLFSLDYSHFSCCCCCCSAPSTSCALYIDRPSARRTHAFFTLQSRATKLLRLQPRTQSSDAIRKASPAPL
jgi:hypothetical protein